MSTNGLTIIPQVLALPLQLGTMIGFAQAGSASTLSHAWDGVKSRVWGSVWDADQSRDWGSLRELDRYEIRGFRLLAFPEPGSHASSYADFRDTVIARSRSYMDRRVGEAHLKFKEHGNFRQIGVKEPLEFAERLVEARGYGIVSENIADAMLLSAAQVFGERDIDVVSSELVSGALRALRKEQFEVGTKACDVEIKPTVHNFVMNGDKTNKWRNRRIVGALVGTAGGVSLAAGSYMLSISAPGIVFVTLGFAGVMFGLSQFFRGMKS